MPADGIRLAGGVYTFANRDNGTEPVRLRHVVLPQPPRWQVFHNCATQYKASQSKEHGLRKRTECKFKSDGLAYGQKLQEC